jgi:ribonucleoside-diphosphate reductase alpha chain
MLKEVSPLTMANLEKITKENRPIYSTEQAFQASKEYFKGDELAARVWVNKYALKDSDGNIYEKTPEEMHKRLASEIGRIEKKYPNPINEEKIYKLIENFKYIVPQGGPMAGIGNDYQIASLSNCFVIGDNQPSDSYGGIMKIDEEQIQLMKRRGGVGHDLSHIRPKGSSVKNSALTSTGIVPFMERYSNSTREVAQDGRRGALMLSVSIKHPDAEDFIDAKLEQGKITGANISVKIDDNFMETVTNGGEYIQQYPINSDNPKVKKEINAKNLWGKIVHNAWKSAEPGILFWDTITRESVPDSYANQGYRTVSTNPCGEIPLCPNDSCRLLAINLYNYVENPFTDKAEFNFDLFKEHAKYSQRIMDDIIDLEIEKIDKIIDKIKSDPESEEVKNRELNLWDKIKNKANEGRRTGIGITAEGDMLAALGLQYGSDDAIDFSTEIHKQLALGVYNASAELAKERGAFGIYDFEKEKDNPFMNRLFEADSNLKEKMQKYGRRNIALLTIAPTGTTSLMTQTTSGIEPVFQPVYKRRRKVNPNDKDIRVDFTDEVGDCWEEYSVFHHKFVDWMVANGYNPAKEYSPEELDTLVKESPYNKATSNDVDWVQKVKMQGAIQKWVDHSISVTVNLPKHATEDTVRKVYEEAWKAKCKGVTVYRDGSRAGVLVGNDEKKEGGLEKEVQGFPKKRPNEPLDADIIRFKNEDEDWIAFVGKISNKPYEIFTGKINLESGFFVPKSITNGKIIKQKEEDVYDGKSFYSFVYKNSHGFNVTVPGISYEFNKEFHNYNKILSKVLGHGMPVEDVVDLVDGLSLDGDNINTWKNGFKRALKKYVPNGTKAKGTCQEDECGGELIYQEGCLICSCCGNSKCG